MSETLDLPKWARQASFTLPQVARYAGPSSRAIQWMGEETRVRYAIHTNQGSISLSIAEAVAMAETIIRDAKEWSER